MYSIEEFDKQKTKVLKYILYKKRTEQEIRNKFSRVIQEDMLDEIMDYLKEAGYIDDSEYIQRAINEFTSLKNLSVKEITYKLYAKGIDRRLIENYIDSHREELEEYERKSACHIIHKKKENTEPEEIKMYLLKKGYKNENIELGEE